MRHELASKSVAELAIEADRDTDETLVALWNAGIESVIDPGDRVPSRSMRQARAALEIDGPNLRTIEGHARYLGVEEPELRRQLAVLGYQLDSNSRRMPKGAHSRLRRYRKSQDLVLQRDNQEGVEPDTRHSEWPTIGRRIEVQYLEPEEINRIHWDLVDRFKSKGDPISPPGIRDETLFESAAFRPRTSLGEVLKYPTVEMSCAALLHSYALDHAFHNGNKRTALVATLVMLYRNGLLCTASEVEILRLVVRTATHNLSLDPSLRLSNSDLEVVAISSWLCSRTRPRRSGDRKIKFMRLRALLTSAGCTFTHPGKGNRINISRTVVEPRFLIPRKSTLSTQIYYRNEGFELEENTLNKIRADLELDDDHGWDSGAFYEKAVEPVDEVVAQYQRTLDRLGRL